MNKIISSLYYLITHPKRINKIFDLYKKLKGRYRFTVILSHAYREYCYNSKFYFKKQNNNIENESSNLSKESNKILLNIHDGILRSGGLTDRIKGMCTLYMYSKNSGYDFKIHFVHPFNLEKYLQPNLYDWRIQEEAISYNLDSTAIYTWENLELANDFFDNNRNKFLQFHVGCNSAECYNDYGQLFYELFKPTNLLSEQIKLNLNNLGGENGYISISFRFQNLLGEFEEANTKVLEKVEKNILIEKCLNKILEIKNIYSNVNKIFVSSDSNLFREIAKTKYKFVYTFIIKDEVGHIDYAGAGKSKELTAFLDMYLIANAFKAFQVRNVQMYNSDFPKLAAKIKNKPYEMVLI